jgi:hypothetical protein
MGMDFIEKAKGSLKKTWDRSRVKLGTPDLLTKYPTTVERSFLADRIGDAPVTVGENVVVQLCEDGVFAYSQLTATARFRDVPSDVLQMVREGGGCINGVVTAIHEVSCTTSITLR